MFAPIALGILTLVSLIGGVNYFILAPRRFMKNPDHDISGKTLLFKRASKVRGKEFGDSE